MHSKHHEIVEKVVCPKCRSFMGVITSDGKGPLMDYCGEKDCPMVEALRDYQPKKHPPGVGNGTVRNDPDAGGYESVARRILEDG